MKSVCEHCNKPIVGRTDKKFCSGTCRKEAHRARTDVEMKKIRDVNTTLLKNRAIMKTLCASGTLVTERRTLLALGMDFSTFTSMYVSGKNKLTYYFCYDYAFAPLMENETPKAVIVARRDGLPAFDPWNSLQSTSPSDQR